ncbi:MULTISPECIES: hypothetical protein [Sulfolobaceae]|nr:MULTISPECIES: hypothetical protein [unclassified Sulfolobus]
MKILRIAPLAEVTEESIGSTLSVYEGECDNMSSDRYLFRS